MATDIITGLKTVEEYLQAVQLNYTPVSLAIRSRRKHDISGAETIQFRRLDVDSDSVVAENLTAGQTEYAHIKAREGVKKFAKVLKGAKIIQSVRGLNFNAIPQLVSKIMRKYSIIFDQIALLGADGNNGVLNTNDPNAVANASVELDTSKAPLELMNDILALLAKVKAQVSAYTASRDVLVYLYGEKFLTALSAVNYNGSSIMETVRRSWPEAQFVVVPSLVDNTKMGMTVISQDLVTLNYVSAPNMSDEDYNRENKYFWADFEVGSTMVDVEEKGALISQPITIKAE